MKYYALDTINTGKDGMGSQLFRRLNIWGYCELHKSETTYLHTPFQRVAHNTDHIIAEKFFNLGMNESLESEFSSKSEIDYVRGCGADNIPSKFFKKNINAYEMLTDKFFEKLKATKKPEVKFDPNKLNVAVHIRRGDICNHDKNFKSKASSDEFYLYAMQKIIENNPTKEIEFFIFSENHEKNLKKENKKFEKSLRILSDVDIFEKFRDLDPSIYSLFIDGDPYFALWHMFNCDCLVASKGCFSGLAAYFTKGDVYVARDKFKERKNNFIVLDDPVEIESLDYYLQ